MASLSGDGTFENANIFNQISIHGDLGLNLLPGATHNIEHDTLLNIQSNEHVDHANVSIIAGTGLMGGGNILESRTLDLTDTGVSATIYGNATTVSQIVVDAQGRITSAANVYIDQGVSTFQTDLDGLTPNIATGGAVILSGTLGETSGGTGLTTYATGDILYAPGANTLAALSAGLEGEVLTISSGVPTWTTADVGNVGGIKIVEATAARVTGNLYVSRAADVAIIDEATLSAVGVISDAGLTQPNFLTQSKNTGLIYVTDGEFVVGNASFSVIDPTTDTVINTYTYGSLAGFRNITLTKDDSKAYITAFPIAGLVVFNFGTSTYQPNLTLPTTLSFHTTLSNDGTKLYASSDPGSVVYVVDTSTDTLSSSITVGITPREVVITTTGIAYVACEGSQDIYVFDTLTDTVITSFATTLLAPGLLAIANDSKLYVGSYGNSNIEVFSIPGHVSLTTIVTGGKTNNLRTSDDGNFVYRVHPTDPDPKILEISTATDTITNTGTTTFPRDILPTSFLTETYYPVFATGLGSNVNCLAINSETGTEGQVLTLNGNGIPSWMDIAGTSDFDMNCHNIVDVNNLEVNTISAKNDSVIVNADLVVQGNLTANLDLEVVVPFSFFRVDKSAGQVIPADSETTVTFDIPHPQNQNIPGTYNGTETFTIDTAGWYELSGGIDFGTTLGSKFSLRFFINGTAADTSGADTFGQSQLHTTATSALAHNDVKVYLNANDLVTMEVLQTTAGNVTLEDAYMSILPLSTPPSLAQVMGLEISVSDPLSIFRVDKSAAQVPDIPTDTTTIVTFDSPHPQNQNIPGTWNGSDTFTISGNAWYELSGAINFGTMVDNKTLLQFFLDGSAADTFGQAQLHTTDTSAFAHNDVKVYISDGQEVTMRVTQFTGGNVTLEDAYMSIAPLRSPTTTSPLALVQLTSAGGAESLVVDGGGPDMSIKGLTAGAGITFTPSINDISISSPSPILLFGHTTRQGVGGFEGFQNSTATPGTNVGVGFLGQVYDPFSRLGTVAADHVTLLTTRVYNVIWSLPVGSFVTFPQLYNNLPFFCFSAVKSNIAGVARLGNEVVYGGGAVDDTVTFNGQFLGGGTTITVPSDGQILPQATINVLSTAIFAASGTIQVTTDMGVQNVTYTGKTPTSFTGCAGGAGTMNTGNLVTATALNRMTVSTPPPITGGSLLPGMFLSGGTIAPNVTIVSQFTGTPGGAGTYEVSMVQPDGTTAYQASQDPSPNGFLGNQGASAGSAVLNQSGDLMWDNVGLYLFNESSSLSAVSVGPVVINSLGSTLNRARGGGFVIYELP